MPDYDVSLRVVGSAAGEGTSRKLERPLGTVTAASENAAIKNVAEANGLEGVFFARPAGQVVRKRVNMERKATVSDPAPDDPEL